jgi:thiol-disulfide isomerase/thioredoxin
MAKWCRKCIYLKPKLQKLFKEEFPDVPLVFIDVNAVPGNLVIGNGIRVGIALAMHCLMLFCKEVGRVTTVPDA